MSEKKRRHRGEGSIFFDPERKLYVGVLSLGVKPDGKRDRRTIYAKTKPELVAALRNLRAEAAKPAKPQGAEQPLREYLDMWLKILKEAGTKSKTLESYEWVTEKFLKVHLGLVALSAVTAYHAHQLFAAMKNDNKTENTQRYAYRVLRSALSYAVEPLKAIPANPFFGVRAPKHKSRVMSTWLPEQCGLFLKTTRSHRLYPAFVLAIDLGMREGEILALQWPEVDFAAGIVRVHYTLQMYNGKCLGRGETKTASGKRELPMTPRVRAALLKRRESLMASGKASVPWVVPNTRGGCILPSNFIRAYTKAVRMVEGLPYIRPHDLRHTHATILAKDGVEAKLLSERLGHASTTTTNIYIHSDLDHQRKLSERFGKIMEGEQ